MTVKEEIEQLRTELDEHNYRYYVLSAPTISDKEFDDKMRRLQDLEAAHPEYADPASPTQRVGSDISKEFVQVTHRYPMLSLGNTYSADEVRDFYERTARLLGEPFEIVAELKKYGTVIPYVQHFIMYNLQWRIKTKIVDNLNNKEKENYINTMRKYLTLIDDDIILFQKQMKNSYKLLALKVKYGNKLEQYLENGEDGIYFKEQLFIPYSSITNNVQLAHIEKGKLVISSEDIDFYTSAKEEIICDYNGNPMDIGFKGTSLMEILTNLDCEEVLLELADPSRPCLILPAQQPENENVLMLIMPMLLND